MGSVLALRALNLGDLLVTVPALRALRRATPGHRLVLATSRALTPLVELAGVADEVLPTAGPEALRWSGPPPDLAVNLHGTGPQSHRALDALRPARRIGYRAPGWDGPHPAGIAARHTHERARWCAVLGHYGICADPRDLRLRAPGGVRRARAGAPVLLHPGARYGSKCWPSQRYAQLAAALERPDRPVFLTGSADERSLAAGIADAAGLARCRVLAGRTDLGQLCAIVAGAALVVSGDTGIAHLASAFCTPSVTLFGPVGPEQWGPPADGPHVALTDSAVRRGDPFASEPDPALLAVGVPDVLRAVHALPGRAVSPVRTARARSGV